MKRVCVILLLLLFFSGCSGTDSDIDKALSVRQRMLKSGGCTFSCEITADYGEILYTFQLDCNADGNGNVWFTVVKPNSISGISGTIDANGGKLKFDDTVLGFPILSENLPTPVCAPWLFITALRSGYIRSCQEFTDGYQIAVADTYEEDSILINTRIDTNHIPFYCEMIWKGYRILSMSFSSFAYL